MPVGIAKDDTGSESKRTEGSESGFAVNDCIIGNKAKKDVGEIVRVSEAVLVGVVDG